MKPILMPVDDPIDDQRQPATHPEGSNLVTGLPVYAASWLDHFFDWMRAVPAPAWLCYLSLWVLLFLLFTGLAWLAGVQPVGLRPLIASDEAMYIVYYLALMHYLDSYAGQALIQFRPLLQVSDSQFARLHYELTTLPARGTLLASGIGLLVTLLSLLFTSVDAMLAGVIGQPSNQFAFLIGNAILAAFAYHTIHQLRMVSRIHATVRHLNLYRRGPIYAFSRLTMRTALGWILGLSLGLSPRIAPLMTLGNFILLWLVSMPLAVLVFTLPLFSGHHLLVREKARLQDEVEQRVEAAFLRLHEQQDGKDLSNLGGLKTLLDSLLVERELVVKLPTWPWKPGTLAGFTSSLLVPLGIWLLQQLLTKWLPVK